MGEKKSFKILSIFTLNRVIWLLTFSDIFSWGMYLAVIGLIGLYLSNILGKDTVEMVGIGIGIYYLVRCITQIPVGLVVDRIKKDRDDIIALMLGNICLGFPFLMYPLIESEYAFYALQAISGLGASLNLVNWRKLFAGNLDNGKEGTSYAVYDTVLSASISLFSFIIGIVANINQFYFDLVMVLVGIFIISSAIWPTLILFVKDRKSNKDSTSLLDSLNHIDS